MYPLKRFPVLAALFVWATVVGCGDDAQTPQVIYVDGAKDFTRVSMNELEYGRQETTYVVALTNDNSERVDWRATTDVSWVSIEPSRGQLPPWSETSLRISVNRYEMSSEKGTGLITIEVPAYDEIRQIGINALK